MLSRLNRQGAALPHRLERLNRQGTALPHRLERLKSAGHGPAPQT